ncbi:MAG: HAMP domain-containing histidine kinase [Peptococcaceae bacterium]|jgi:signal transduction histidine kinase|nr:HAMP domain-containing histidine kinase [Peptococcaceae bacterium]
MKYSVLLRRVIGLLLAAVLLSGFLTAGIYYFVTQKMYVATKADELLPIARTIADLLGGVQQYGEYGQGVNLLLDRDNKSFLGASLHIYNAGGQSVMNQPSGLSPRGPKGDIAADEYAIAPVIAADLQAVLGGVDAVTIRKSAAGESLLVVGVPIQSGDAIRGAVFFTKAMRELNEASRGLYLALVVSTLISFCVMLIPGYLAARKLIVPIRQMRDVARSMADGDFSVRADVNQKGEIGELSRAMNHFADESARMEQTRRDFIANVSHELRTPIASIRAIGETLRDDMVKTEEKKALFYNNIVRESLRLSRLVDDLLELSRLQSGVAAMQKSSFNLLDVFQNILDTFAHAAESAAIRLRLCTELDGQINAPYAEQASVRVYTNPDRIEQVLIVLVDNALKHTNSGGEIRLIAAASADRIAVSVTNTGEGILPEDLPHVFERFYQADKSHASEGTGLGLAIAAEIIKGLGESIRVASSEGMTRFTFTLDREA